MFFRFVAKSSNRKTGPIPLVSASSDTCWVGCPFRECCYKNSGWLQKHARQLDKSGLSFQQVADRIGGLPPGAVWRWGDIGDLPGQDAIIDWPPVLTIAAVNQGKRGFCYTHKPVLVDERVHKNLVICNRHIIDTANREGFCVNLSAEGLGYRPDEMLALKIAPVVTVLPSTTPADWRKIYTPVYPHSWHIESCH